MLGQGKVKEWGVRAGLEVGQRQCNITDYKAGKNGQRRVKGRHEEEELTRGSHFPGNGSFGCVGADQRGQSLRQNLTTG